MVKFWVQLVDAPNLLVAKAEFSVAEPSLFTPFNLKRLFSFITNYLEPLACLLYFVAVLLNRKTTKRADTQILSIYYMLGTLVLLTGSVAVKVTNNNMWAYDLMALFTAVFIGLYFYRLFQSQAKKRTVLVLVIAYLLYAVLRNFTLEGPRLFDSIGYSIVAASVAVYVFMYFHDILKNVTEANILGEFNFWLASGYLIYFVGSFIIFVSYYYFTNKILDTFTQPERDILTALWGMHNVLLFVSALSLLIGSLWITYRRKLD